LFDLTLHPAEKETSCAAPPSSWCVCLGLSLLFVSIASSSPGAPLAPDIDACVADFAPAGTSPEAVGNTPFSVAVGDFNRSPSHVRLGRRRLQDPGRLPPRNLVLEQRLSAVIVLDIRLSLGYHSEQRSQRLPG
jgi:hypothetical protein